VTVAAASVLGSHEPLQIIRIFGLHSWSFLLVPHT
jgi:hypothetical protein